LYTADTPESTVSQPFHLGPPDPNILVDSGVLFRCHSGWFRWFRSV